MNPSADSLLCRYKKDLRMNLIYLPDSFMSFYKENFNRKCSNCHRLNIVMVCLICDWSVCSLHCPFFGGATHKNHGLEHRETFLRVSQRHFGIRLQRQRHGLLGRADSLAAVRFGQQRVVLGYSFQSGTSQAPLGLLLPEQATDRPAPQVDNAAQGQRPDHP